AVDRRTARRFGGQRRGDGRRADVHLVIGPERRESRVVELVLHPTGRDADGQRPFRRQTRDGVADGGVSGQDDGARYRALAEHQVTDAGRGRVDRLVGGYGV